jgi:hypothetical protein
MGAEQLQQLRAASLPPLVSDVIFSPSSEVSGSGRSGRSGGSPVSALLRITGTGEDIFAAPRITVRAFDG